MNKTLNHKDYAPVTVVINGETLNNGSQESILNMKTSRNYAEQEEARLLRRRRLTILLITLVFILAGAVLTASVIHDVNNRRKMNPEDFVEIECSKDDEDCISSLCPEGMVWNEEQRKCIIKKDYTCCTLCTHEYKCYPRGQETRVKCCYTNGVVPAAYKQTCKDGFLWVHWKKVCVRKN